MAIVLACDLPLPRDWQVFEDFCLDLFRQEWGSLNAQKYGRSGERQFGVDVYGRFRGEWHGVQCKRISRKYPERKLSKKAIQKEVDEAKEFQTKQGRPLKTLLIATTSEPGRTLQDFARDLTDKHETQGLFEVAVEGWSGLCARLRRYPDRHAAWYASLVGATAGWSEAETLLNIRLNQAAPEFDRQAPENAWCRASTGLRKATRKTLEELLVGSDALLAVGAAAEQLGVWREIYEKRGNVGDVIVAILDHDEVVEAVVAITKAHARLWTRGEPGRRAASILEEVLYHALPVMFRDSLQFAGNSSQNELSFSISAVSMVEVYLSAFDCRPLQPRWRGKEFPDGAGHLPLPAEAGFDLDNRGAIAEYERFLANSELPLARRERYLWDYFEDAFLDQGLLTREFLAAEQNRALDGRTSEIRPSERVLQEVNDAIEHDAEVREPGLVRYLSYKPAFKDQYSAFLNVMQSGLKGLHFVERAGDQGRDESRIGRCLRDIMERRREADER